MTRRPIVTLIVLVVATAFIVSAGAIIAAENKAKKSINWMYDYNKAVQKAKKDSKPMMISFGASYCKPCKKLDAETFVDSKVIDQSKKFVCVKIDIEKQKSVADKFKLKGIPTVVFTKSTAKEVLRTTGFKSADEFVKIMKEALKKSK